MKDQVRSILNMAIRREEEAFWFYKDLARKVKDETCLEAIEWITGEEEKHRNFLVKYKEGQIPEEMLRLSDATEYKIAEYVKEPEKTENIASRDLFLVAAHREKRSHDFYADFASLHSASEIKDVLLKMASEELKHKEKMEYLYTNTAFPQTDGG